MESTSKPVGKQIGEMVDKLGSEKEMNEDNKNMLKKVIDVKTNKEVVKTLLTEPVNGVSMSYMESRMRFG